MKSLIICPSGNPVPKQDGFDNENHWRYTDRGSRNYDTLIVSYNDFVHPENTYDTITKMKGMKWSIVKALLPTIDISQYEYIGFVDDDLLMTIDDVNFSLGFAGESGAGIFQLSTSPGSDSYYRLLHQNHLLSHSITNFIEVMAPFIHVGLIPTLTEFWNMYDINTGWGFDLVLSDITQTYPMVIHERSMIHPKKEVSDYDKNPAMMEQIECVDRVYPYFMKTKYGIDTIRPIEPTIVKRYLKES